MRLRLDLAYDGTDFHGWAIQPRLRTVQGTFEASLATILRVEQVRVTCAGRTDAGVHARGQVVHADVDGDVLRKAVGRSAGAPVAALAKRLNGLMPDDVRVLHARAAPAAFDARYSALWRRYAYRIADAPHVVDPLTRRMVLTWPRPLDVAAMNEAAGFLVGEHDFAAFCRRREGKTTVRTLLELSWSRDGNGQAVALVRADAFLRSMVRSLVGCMLAVGENRKDPAWAGEVLGKGTRDAAVNVVRGHGLTLEEVAYPPDDELRTQAQPQAARSVRTLVPLDPRSDG